MLEVNVSKQVNYTTINWSSSGRIRDRGGGLPLVDASDLSIPATAILVADTARTYDNLEVNGTITHSGPQTSEIYKINYTLGNLTITSTGAININVTFFVNNVDFYLQVL